MRYTCPECTADISDLVAACANDELSGATEERQEKAARKVAKFKTQRNDARTQLATAQAKITALETENAALRATQATSTAANKSSHAAAGKNGLTAAAAIGAANEEANARVVRVLHPLALTQFGAGFAGIGGRPDPATARRMLGLSGLEEKKAKKQRAHSELSPEQAQRQRELAAMMNPPAWRA